MVGSDNNLSPWRDRFRMLELLEEKLPEKYFWSLFLLFLRVSILVWGLFGEHSFSCLFYRIYGEVLFLRDGHLKLEMNVEVITSKVPPLHKTCKRKAVTATRHATTCGVTSVHVSKWQKRKARRFIFQFLQIYDPWLMFLYKPCLIPKWVWGSMNCYTMTFRPELSFAEESLPKDPGFCRVLAVCLDSCIMLFHSKINQLNLLLSWAI